MPLSKTYSPTEAEPRWMQDWQQAGTYHFDPGSDRPVYSIDTPPPTVSGHLHLGHVYSYTHADLFARFWRMRGRNVFYPMGYDDNGLPTERLVEKRLKITAAGVGRQAFIQKCLEVSEEAEKDYRQLWQRLGLSIDWRYSYRTIDDRSRAISQRSFIELYRAGRAYRQEAPAIWCPECRTSIAQAELDDLERESEFVTLRFALETDPAGGLPVATTRPELLPACVAVFVHPQDGRYNHLAGRQVTVPVFGQRVPVLLDPAADPAKGTGAVMCCTFGDTTDVAWWRAHRLPLLEAIDRSGRMTAIAGDYAGLPLVEARRRIKQDLEAAGLLLDRQPTSQSVRVHERCDTPVEYILVGQWFIRLLDERDALLQAGEQLDWRPDHMIARYRAWVENLGWDWCISRQRYYGVPFPLWYCTGCGQAVLAEADRLPVDPQVDRPDGPCPGCGGTQFRPEEDILDTWATSSMTPQIVGQMSWDAPDTGLYRKVFPFSLRPQAHEIIRTWAFYTLAKSRFHFGALPWKDVLISGWGLAGEGMGKISKSKGGGPMPPLEMIQRYSADAVRYWAASTSPGKDSIISEERIQMGARLVTKLWNVARFAERFISPAPLPVTDSSLQASFTLADRWILARSGQLADRVTVLMEQYEYASARSEIEAFFWGELADNYLEMCKQRLYDPAAPAHQAARAALAHVLLAVIRLLAPFLPYVTEEIYRGLFAGDDKPASIHSGPWPEAAPAPGDAEGFELAGAALVEIATCVRRYKSERNLPLGTGLSLIKLAPLDAAAGGAVASGLLEALRQAEPDLMSITRAAQIRIETNPAQAGAFPVAGGSLGVEIFPL